MTAPIVLQLVGWAFYGAAVWAHRRDHLRTCALLAVLGIAAFGASLGLLLVNPQ